MTVFEKYLSFNGTSLDALNFVQTMREMQNDTGLEWPKVFGDFLFAIEVALQNEGLLDEDFNATNN